MGIRKKQLFPPLNLGLITFLQVCRLLGCFFNLRGLHPPLVLSDNSDCVVLPLRWISDTSGQYVKSEEAFRLF
jgi:hypothetical protein